MEFYKVSEFINDHWVRTDKRPVGWRLLNSSFRVYDQLYRRLHKLHNIDHFISVKKLTYRGETEVLQDGTRLQDGEPYLVLHFNNDYLERLHEQGEMRSNRRAAVAFGANIIRSMQRLHYELELNPHYANVDVITGTTWFKTHGEKIGFESRPLKEGMRKSLMRIHFKILLRALFPGLADRENQRLEPHQFWLTRRQLRKTVTEDDNYVAKRLAQYHQPKFTV